MIYEFGDCELDLRRYELRRAGAVRRVEPQVFDVLLLLVRERERVVSKEEILDTVWGSRFVSESALTSRIKALRQVVGDDGKAQRVVRTVHGRGYRFVAEVVEREDDSSPKRPVGGIGGELPPQEIRFCTTGDGVRLAYATMGDGPPLVKAANWLSHLDYDRETVVWRHWLAELADRHLLVRYDERGCGLSDWDVPDLSFAAWVRDLEAVVDAVGLDRFPLLGISQGGPVAVAYAVRHPERVSHLVLLGAFAQGRRKRATTAQQLALTDARIELVRVGWGQPDPQYRHIFVYVRKLEAEADAPRRSDNAASPSTYVPSPRLGVSLEAARRRSSRCRDVLEQRHGRRSVGSAQSDVLHHEFAFGDEVVLFERDRAEVVVDRLQDLPEAVGP